MRFQASYCVKQVPEHASLNCILSCYQPHSIVFRKPYVVNLLLLPWLLLHTYPCSPLNNEKRRGKFVCAGCNTPLFSSETKYNSGTGWPSFFEALDGAYVVRGDRWQLAVAEDARLFLTRLGCVGQVIMGQN